MFNPYFYFKLLLIMFATISTVCAQQWVEFDAASVPLSALKINQAKAKGIDLKPEPGTRIGGYLFQPESDGKHPGIVMIHDCRGVQDYQKQMASELVLQGYVILIVDSFSPRNEVDICPEINDLVYTELVGARNYDFYGALEYIRTLSFVNPDKVALVGWDPVQTLNMVYKNTTRIEVNGEFSAVVSFYADCTRTSTGEFTTPTLILIGELNDWWAPASECQKMTNIGKQSGSIIDLIIYPEAHYAFDDPAYTEKTWRDDVFSHGTRARGATFHFNAQATEQAKQKIKSFLHKYLSIEVPI